MPKGGGSPSLRWRTGLFGDSDLISPARLGIAATVKAHPEIFAAVCIAGGLQLAWPGGHAL